MKFNFITIPVLNKHANAGSDFQNNNEKITRPLVLKVRGKIFRFSPHAYRSIS